MSWTADIVDIRLRPRWLNRQVGSRDVDHFAAAADLPALLAEIRRAVGALGLRGVNFDTGFWATPMLADADLFLPLHGERRRLGVPAFVMSGPITPDLAFNDPWPSMGSPTPSPAAGSASRPPRLPRRPAPGRHLPPLPRHDGGVAHQLTVGCSHLMSVR